MAFSSLFIVCRRGSHASRHLASVSLLFRDSSPFQFFSCFTSSSSAANTSKPNPSQAESASQFLLNDLGLSSSELSKINKIYRRFFVTEAPLKRSVEALQLFRSYGFTDTQIKRVFTQCPALFACKVEEVLRPRLQLIKGLGLSNEDLARTLSQAPRTLSAKDLEANIALYKSIFHGDANLLAVLKSCPSLLSRNPQASAKVRINLLKQCGFNSNSIHYIIKRAPLILTYPMDALRARLEFLENMGFKEPTKAFATALSKTIRYSLETLHQKCHHLMVLGLTEEELKRVVLMNPMVLCNSCEKVQRIMDYLLIKGVRPGVVIDVPFIFGMSLEKRIIPRNQAFQFLCRTLGKDKVRSLPSLMKMTEKAFLKKYVEGNPDAEKLLQIYRAESNPLPQ